MKTYYLLMIFSLVGLALGVYLSVTGYKYTSLLVTSDKILFDYITGTASYMSIFYTRLKNYVLFLLIILLFNLTYYTAFLNYIFIAYQNALMILSCAGVISLYRLSGILNSLFFILPVNILNILTLAYLIAISVDRSRAAHKYKIDFSNSFRQTFYFEKFAIGVGILFVLCVINSLVLPLIMKSFIIITF